MSIKQENIPPHIQRIVDQLDEEIKLHKEQIDYHNKAISDLLFRKQVWLKHQPEQVKVTKINTPLTRDLIRNFLKGYGHAVQTIQVIDLLYKNKSEDERSKLIKTLSVIFNQMEKEGEIIIEKKEGVKGNFYKWKK